MPRAIWSGSISFGLVNVPVRMYSAIQEHKLHFNYVHVKDGSRIGYEKICKEEGKPVPDEEIAKAFEWEPGEYVIMSDEDFDAVAEDDGGRTIGDVAIVGVLQEWRRRGLGRELLRWGVHRVRELGSSEVFLAVEGENERALRLYEETGFVRSEEWPRWARADSV